MADQYDWWRRAIQMTDGGTRQLTEQEMAQMGDIHDGHPESGRFRFYRRASGDKPAAWLPVAIWREGDEVKCLVNGATWDPNPIWPFICQHPITNAIYKSVVEDDEPWPDDLPANPRGHNLPDDINAFDALSEELAGEREQAEDFLKSPIETEERAAQVAAWTKRLSGLRKRLDEAFTEEKAPHRAAAEAVDKKWRDIRAEPKELSDKLKEHLKPYLDKKAKEEAEKAKAAAAEAERLRQEQEKFAEEQMNVGIQSSTEKKKAVAKDKDLKAKIRAADKASKAGNTQVGRTGAKVSFHTVIFAEITDYDKAVAFFRNHPDVRSTVKRLADQHAGNNPIVDSGKTGFERREEKRAR